MRFSKYHYLEWALSYPKENKNIINEETIILHCELSRIMHGVGGQMRSSNL